MKDSLVECFRNFYVIKPQAPFVLAFLAHLTALTSHITAWKKKEKKRKRKEKKRKEKERSLQRSFNYFLLVQLVKTRV